MDLFLRFVAGVIRLERLHRFEQVLWRACHGNVFMRHAEINEDLEDPTTVCIVLLYSHCAFSLTKQYKYIIR